MFQSHSFLYDVRLFCVMTQNEVLLRAVFFFFRFCRITFMQTSAWGVGRVGWFGKADFLALTLTMPRFPWRIRGGAWSRPGVPPAVKGVPHPRSWLWQWGRNVTDTSLAFWRCFELK